MEQVPKVIERSLPNGVRYDLTSPGYVTISLPPTSTWSSGLHWHESHTEYLKVVRGSIKVRVGTVERIVSATAANQPEIKVDKYVWHEWRRAELGGEEVVVIERTDPADGQKALFFWNLNGVILNVPKMMDEPSSFLSRCPNLIAQLLLTLLIELNLMVIFAHLDNVPAFFNLPNSRLRVGNLLPVGILVAMEWFVSHFILSMAALLGWLVGLHPVTRHYTPEQEFADWAQSREYGRKND
ncbi:cupin, RmlC-type [Pochonia chlamydosporia 170]|uniref:Cupin, RmlC-type n=1 Tax=Pochonia chlamydosporia 170 TaxID=1380566 RepID=A0A179G2D5_METCM|nr:cupin, RmlC-type [Pochonia chlamydosporia 170]OAQ72025.1 cupin, RmlC-type [Pochonia chlamydosporia 170]